MFDKTCRKEDQILTVFREAGKLRVRDNVTWAEEAEGELKPVFEDGRLLVDWTLSEIRERVKNEQ